MISLRIFIPSLFLALPTRVNSQAFTASLIPVDQECRPGHATLAITGTTPNETVTVEWSTGEQQSRQLDGLNEGDYSVKVTVKKGDSVIVSRDTLIGFHIGKKECPVSISNFFSPNSDGYNDVLNVGRVEYYPNFEFQVFNKWGQKVHGQRKNFTPWDGTWNGLALPDGTYYYIFIYDASDPHNLTKGDITIMR